MKSTASNTSNRQMRNQQQTTPINRPTHPAGSTGHLSSNSVAAAATEVSLADQEARQALHETKKAIDHLKSVTGRYFFVFYTTQIFK